MPGLQNSVERFLNNLGLPKKELIDAELDSRITDIRSKTEKDRSIHCKEIQNCMAIITAKSVVLVDKICPIGSALKEATDKAKIEYRNPSKDLEMQNLKICLKKLEDQKKEAEELWDDLRELIPLSALYKKQN